MGCYINNYNGSADYGDLADSSNIFWMVYLISGFVIFGNINAYFSYHHYFQIHPGIQIWYDESEAQHSGQYI
jgi:hypothetical protein